jgi:cell division protein FtsZ
MDEQAGLFEKKKSAFTFDEQLQVPAKIVAMGIGGIGLKSINRMVEAKIPGVELMAIDSNVRVLRKSRASIKLEIGTRSTKGSGCSGNPKLGRKIALEEAERMLDLLKGCDMVFLIGGEGGGTFTGAAPIFSGLASEIGAITIAMATMPLSLQGLTRRKHAETGIQELKEAADALIAISNEDLYGTLDEDVLLEDSFSFAEDTFCSAVRDLTEIITKPGILNLELSDVRTIMQERRVRVIGTGVAEGPNRAPEAVQHAITNPLLGDMPINEVKSVLMNVTGSRQSLRLHEAKSAAKLLEELANLEDMVIGAMYDDSMEDRLKVTLIASGPFRDASEQQHNLELVIGTRDDVMAMEQSAQWDGSSGNRNKTNWEELDRPAFRRRHSL